MEKASYDAEGAFCLKFYDDGQFSTEFANGDNIETAMQAFAGKNGEILFFTLLYLLRKEPRLIISQKILKRKNSKFA